MDKSKLTLEQRIFQDYFDHKSAGSHSDPLIKYLKKTYKDKKIPEEIITEKLYNYIEGNLKKDSIKCQEIYDAFSERLEKYEKIKKSK